MTREPLALPVGEMRAVVIGYRARPSTDVGAMNHAMVDRWNDVPADGDEVSMDEVWMKEGRY